MGAMRFTDNLGNLLATTMVHGVGQGPAIAFAPGVQTTVPASGLNQMLGVAVDAAGDVFIADTYNSRVVEVPAGGGAQTTVGSGLCASTGVASGWSGQRVHRGFLQQPGGGGSGRWRPPDQLPVSGLYTPYRLAVNGAGNVFITDIFNSPDGEGPPGGVQTTVASGLNEPIAVALDAADDVFIADYRNNRVVEVPAGCTAALPDHGSQRAV